MTRQQKLESMRFWISQITGNANFPSPLPTAATMAAGANQLEAAALVAKGGGPDDTAAMRLKEEAANLLMRQFAAYVENTANATPASAEAIILSAGLQVRKGYSRTKRVVDAMLTGKSGEIRVQHEAVRGATYEVQISTDISKEENWSTFYAGTRSRVTKGGLTPNTRYYFRVRVTSRDGRSDWSEVRSVYLPA